MHRSLDHFASAATSKILLSRYFNCNVDFTPVAKLIENY
uniref:Uncharacterized protein n=1 Tax=Anguilla anguilla TaxID=7936 RepID=A0A0E9SEG7_ANGAN